MTEFHQNVEPYRYQSDHIGGTGAVQRRVVQVSLAALVMAGTVGSARAQELRCEAPTDSVGTTSIGTTAADRLRDANPGVRAMARADMLSDEGRQEEAAAIYRRLAAAPTDRRQTARRANLRLAQAAMSAGDFQLAETYVATAMRAGANADLQSRGRRMRATIAYRRGIAASEAALDDDALVAAGRTDEAIQATQNLLTRPCPYPADFHARVKTRLARIYRAKGDFASARAIAMDAQASATTPNIKRGAALLITEIDTAEQVAQMRARIEQANGFITAGNSAAAIAIFEPMLAGPPPLPAELDTTVRLRLARALVQSGRHADAVALVEPLRSAPSQLNADESETAARIYIAQAANLLATGNSGEAAIAYQQVLNWNPEVVPELRDSARLGLGRALAAQGDRTGALQQVALVRDGGSSPELIERARNLFADIQEEAPLNRLFGYIEAGVAYDSNAPTLVSAVRENDDDLPFAPNQRFDDMHAKIAARLQYRQQLGESANYMDFGVSGLRTFQKDLPQLDRTRVEVAAGPVFVSAAGKTELRIGAQFVAEWRGDRFRSSEPGIYLGVKHRITPRLSAAAKYGLAWHNDYRDERDGIDHTLDTQIRYELTDADVLTFDLRAEREGGKIDRVRNWGLSAGGGWRHRWPNSGSVVPFVEIGGDVERVRFDGLTSTGQKRRDWRVKAEAAVGADIDGKWRARLHYAYYDVSSNVIERNRLPNHQVGFTVRYLFN